MDTKLEKMEAETQTHFIFKQLRLRKITQPYSRNDKKKNKTNGKIRIIYLFSKNSFNSADETTFYLKDNAQKYFK